MRPDAVLPLEPESQAGGDEFEDGTILLGLALGLIEIVEQMFSRGRIAVQGAGQAGRLPDAVGAPGRVQHHVVDQRAQRVMRQPDHALVQPPALRPLAEGAQLTLDLRAQLLGRRRRRARPQQRQHGEQAERIFNQRSASGRAGDTGDAGRYAERLLEQPDYVEWERAALA